MPIDDDRRDLHAALAGQADKDARRALWVVAFIIGILCTIEAIGHALSTPEQTRFIALPAGSALLLFALVGVTLTRPGWVRGPSWWGLLPLSVVILSMWIHLAAGVEGVLVYLAAALMACAVLFTHRGPLLVALTTTVSVFTYWALRLYGPEAWPYPVGLLPVAAALAWLRHRTLRDAELRRALERDLERKSAELDRLSGMADMAAGVTHHFNNLLTGILGGTSSALASLPPGHEARTYLEMAVSSSERAAQLIRSLGAYTGRTAARDERFPVQQLIDAAALREHLPAGPSLHIEMPEVLPELRGSLDDLRQAIANIVGNAGEACGAEDGRVEILVTREIGRHQLRIDIRDTGPGIDPRTAGRMFEPFYTTREPSRQGLGLTFAQGVVRRHGGTITASNHDDGGTCVTIHLPAAEPDPRPARRGAATTRVSEGP
ncbi:MAG: ATP-binding protein [Pseudomonadales bacterium]|jgi:signal transduction histidine kinase|nr:ATP-binding protein [Pseudomonadales bacterium]